MNPDLGLSYKETIVLIASIKHWQEERKRRLRFWWKERRNGDLGDLPKIMIKENIDLIREQTCRLHFLETAIALTDYTRP